MKLLVIGLGSMGKRRIRNFQALGATTIAGFDPREDRSKEASELYAIPTSTDFDEVSTSGQFDAWIISVPPDVHHIYLKEAIKRGIPCFVEASVVDTDMDAIIAESKQKQVLVAPSCTLLFHPAIKKIKQLLSEKYLGTVSNIIYHSGQYLPDWHSYEPVSSYYVSNPATGGAREIVPFELTWLTHTIGFPSSVAAIYKKTIDIDGAEKIDDTYNMLMDYNSFILNLNVDVVSRYATRKMTINGSEKQLLWDWNENAIKVYHPESEIWETIAYEVQEAQEGYNKNITEQMYIDEMNAFKNAVLNKAAYPNSLEHDHAILKLLYKAEESYQKKEFALI